MVLSVVTMLTLALTMMVGFNISHTVHEKIRIQQAADAQAYSSAVLQARVMNINAVLNRAIAAMTVAQMSLHAWNEIATHEVNMLEAGQWIFIEIGLIELGLCLAWQFAHCPDAVQAFIIAAQYASEHSNYDQKLQGHESDFNNAVQMMYLGKKLLYGQELAFSYSVYGELSGGSILDDMLKKSAPNASAKSSLRAINMMNLVCAQDGPNGAVPPCAGAEPLVFQRSRQAPSERSKQAQNAANAARPDFNMGKPGAINDGTDFLPGFGRFVINPSKMMDIQSEGLFIATYFNDFESRTGQNFSQSSSNSHTAEDVGSSNDGIAFGQWRHGVGVFPLSSGVYSDQNSGQHNGGGHSGSHGEFKTIAQLNNEASLITFNAHPNASADNDWGQPSAYAGVEQDLRLMQNTGKGGAYEVAKNGSGTINIKIGNESHKVTLVSETSGVAVAKAKSYFHQLGAGWKLSPNGFDPFWRAKLHPFRSRAEFSAALGLAGDPHMGVLGPYEGEE